MRRLSQNCSFREVSIRILPGQYADSETNTSYNYFRDYNPAVGRYIQSDPIGLLGGMNPYLYVGANPLRYFDVDALLPGDKFRTPSDAAIDALNYARTKTPQFVEWGGWIYQADDQCYTYDEPTKGTPEGLTLPPSPVNAAATYHTHPYRGVPTPSGEEYSPGDVLTNKRLGMPGYLRTPAGMTKKQGPGGPPAGTVVPNKTPERCEPSRQACAR